MARKKKEPPDEGGCALWVVTFGDAMSLLVTFFVMLVSFADFEEHKLQSVFGALKGGLRAIPLPTAVAVGGMEGKTTEAKGSSSPEQEKSDVLAGEQMVTAESMEQIVRSTSSDYYLHLLANGVSLVIDGKAVFDPGTATLASREHEVWGVARKMISMVNNEVRVCVTLPENVVVRLRDYKTAWGLGIEQAVAVQDLLSEFNKDQDHGQISTAIRVLKQMPRHTPQDGMVEVVFVGFNEQMMKTMPSKILKEKWRDMPQAKEEGSFDG